MSGPTDVNPTPALPPLDELRRAVLHGVVDVARTLLEVDPSLGRASSASGGSLLLEAVEREHYEIASLLLTARERTGGEHLDLHESCALGRPGAVGGYHRRPARRGDRRARRLPPPAPRRLRGDAEACCCSSRRRGRRGLERGAPPPLHSAVAGHARARSDSDAAVVRACSPAARTRRRR